MKLAITTAGGGLHVSHLIYLAGWHKAGEHGIISLVTATGGTVAKALISQPGLVLD